MIDLGGSIGSVLAYVLTDVRVVRGGIYSDDLMARLVKVWEVRQVWRVEGTGPFRKREAKHMRFTGRTEGGSMRIADTYRSGQYPSKFPVI